MEAFVDLREEVLFAKWESVVEGMLPRSLLQKRTMISPWREATSPLYLLRCAYSMIRQKAVPWSIFICVFSALVGLSSMSCLFEVTRFLYVCSCLKSSVESSQALFSAVAAGRASRRKVYRDLLLQALATLACDKTLPRSVCEAFLVTRFLLDASLFFLQRGEQIISDSFKSMGSSLGSFVVASPRASAYQPKPSVSFEEEDCCILTPKHSFSLQAVDVGEEDTSPFSATLSHEASPEGGCEASEPPAGLAGAPEPEDPPEITSKRRLRRLVRIDDLDTVSLEKLGPLFAEVPRLDRRCCRESVLTLEEFVE
jgi:hypothetical protein